MLLTAVWLILDILEGEVNNVKNYLNRLSLIHLHEWIDEDEEIKNLFLGCN